jgi:hypothetical protein
MELISKLIQEDINNDSTLKKVVQRTRRKIRLRNSYC